MSGGRSRDRGQEGMDGSVRGNFGIDSAGGYVLCYFSDDLKVYLVKHTIIIN